MSPIVAFVLGLLAGWLVEWVIDWVYWRRKKDNGQVEADAACRSRVFELEQEVASYRNQLSALQSEKAQLEAQRIQPPVRETAAPVEETVRTIPIVRDREIEAAPETAAPLVEPEPAPAPTRDRLEDISEISPGLAESLYQAGINTFADLGRLSPKQLRAMAAENLNEPESEVVIIRRARLAAGMIKKVDDLVIIDGIGPVIARLLNNAGIFTFAELAALDEAGLREIVGERIQRLANEGKILRQAKELAERQM